MPTTAFPECPVCHIVGQWLDNGLAMCNVPGCEVCWFDPQGVKLEIDFNEDDE